MIEALSQLHFLRPQWLWTLLALPLLAGAWHWQRRRRSAWRAAVDPHLLPHLLDRRAGGRGFGGLALRLGGWTLAALALAGPSWRQGDAPLQQDGRPLVIALDLSSATLAGDLPPSRLAQARATLATLLRERTGGDIALVAFADDAYTVAPLTDDAENVALFLDALNPDVMPVDGHRPERAIEAAIRLLAQAGYRQGDVLLLSDRAGADAIAAAGRAAAGGWRVSALGLGSARGAAYRGGDGSIARARLDAASLRALSAAGGGGYAELGVDAAGLQALQMLHGIDAGVATADARGSTRVWRDEGYWLLLPLLLLGLCAFRRGAAFAVIVLCLCLPLPYAQAQAPEGGAWRRADQVAHARMRDGQEAYRAGDFDAAARAWRGLPGADAAYNRGNALARAGHYDEALRAYDDALRQAPGMADAVANRRAVEAAMQRRPPAGGSRSREDGDDPQGQRRRDQGRPAQGAPSDRDAQQDAQAGDAPQQDGASEPDSSRAGRRGDAPPDEDDPARDPQSQQAADAAQRERMQRALQQGALHAADGSTTEGAPDRAETQAERERRQATEAWLRRVPDDPGGLLRAKFRLEHERRNGAGGTR